LNFHLLVTSLARLDCMPADAAQSNWRGNAWKEIELAVFPLKFWFLPSREFRVMWVSGLQVDTTSSRNQQSQV